MLVLAHTRTAFDSQLQGLSLLIAEMGGLVEGQIVEATAALSNRDAERARQTIATDALIDRMQRAVEEKAIEKFQDILVQGHVLEPTRRVKYADVVLDRFTTSVK